MILSNDLGGYKQYKDELIFKVCPFCGNDRWNFQINPNLGVYHCWACTKGGSLKELRSVIGNSLLRLVDSFTTSLTEEERSKEVFLPSGYEDVWLYPEDSKLIQYLKSRNVTVKDMIFWKIKGKDDRWLLFPFYGDEDKLLYWAVKDVEEGSWRLAPGEKSKIVWFVRRDFSDNRVYIVEGIFDGIRVTQCGYNTIVLLGHEVSSTLWQKVAMFSLVPVFVVDADIRWDWYLDLYNRYGEFLFVKLEEGDPADYSPSQLKSLLNDRVEKFGFKKSLEVRWR